MKANELATYITRFLEDKKAEDIVSLDVSEKSSIADYYVICTGRSMTHVKSLAENLEEELEKSEIAPLRREGVRDGRWAVLDYGDVIVHIFNDENRLFYHLEQLFSNDKNKE